MWLDVLEEVHLDLSQKQKNICFLSSNEWILQSRDDMKMCDDVLYFKLIFDLSSVCWTKIMVILGNNTAYLEVELAYKIKYFRLSIRFYYTSCNVSLTSGYNVFLKTKFKKTVNVIFHHVRQNFIWLKDVRGNKICNQSNSTFD